MASKLPAELVDLVIGQLEPDKSSIGRCGLVCKAWLYSSRSRVFHSVHLREGNMAALFDITETALVPLLSLIEAVDITEPDDDTTPRLNWLDGIARLGPCHRLAHLYLQIGDRALDGLSVFLTGLASLSILELCVLPTTSASSILKILSHLPPSLDYLSILNPPEDFFRDHTFPSDAQLPASLRTLYVDDDAENLFSALLLLTQIPLFPIVHLRNAWPTRNSALEKYLRLVGGTVQDLEFDLTDEFPFPSRCFLSSIVPVN